jgi:DNA-binding transcriptional ArsR family regulator
LRVLKDAGLVKEEKQGTRRVYSVELQGLVALRRYPSTPSGADALAAFAAEAEAESREEAGPKDPPRGPKTGRR